MDWIEFLNDLFEKSTLDKFDHIYYLGSIKAINENDLDQAFETKKISKLLIKSETDIKYDLLDFFLFENDTEKNLIVIFDPFDLWENEEIFKTYSNFEEDFSHLPEFLEVK